MRTQTVIAMAVQQMTCTGCGAEANASCNCGKPYVPKKQRAADAIKANPQKSDRAIAADLGINQSTVSRARSESGDASASPEREGRDGKIYHLPARNDDEDDPDIEADIEPANYRGAFLIRADQAKHFASYSGPVTKEIVVMARQVGCDLGKVSGATGEIFMKAKRRHRHCFRFRIKGVDGNHQTIEAWAKIVRARFPVALDLAAEHVRKSIKLKGVGNTFDLSR
jgi:hypothetical protein